MVIHIEYLNRSTKYVLNIFIFNPVIELLKILGLDPEIQNLGAVAIVAARAQPRSVATTTLTKKN